MFQSSGSQPWPTGRSSRELKTQQQQQLGVFSPTSMNCNRMSGNRVYIIFLYYIYFKDSSWFYSTTSTENYYIRTSALGTPSLNNTRHILAHP